MSPGQWQRAYAGRPEWGLGRPQPAFRALADEDVIRGRVLDCGLFHVFTDQDRATYVDSVRWRSPAALLHALFQRPAARRARAAPNQPG